MTLPSPFEFINSVVEDARQRVAGSGHPVPAGGQPVSVEQLELRKLAEWRAMRVPEGTAQAALSWAKRIARGYADKFPVEVRERRYAELLPTFLDDAEQKYIRAVLRSMGLEAKG